MLVGIFWFFLRSIIFLILIEEVGVEWVWGWGSDGVCLLLDEGLGEGGWGIRMR